jgi:hypothetical protein
MSIFNTILQKLGLQKPAAPAAPAQAPKPAPAAPAAPPRPTQFKAQPGQMTAHMEPGMSVPPKASEMAMVDVTAKLDDLAKHFSVPVEWRVSINDLMAILGMGHTPDDIKELAVELGCPESELGDSYKRNVWTHKALLKKIAENGGKLPPELLD